MNATPDHITAAARYAVVVGDNVYDLSGASLATISDWFGSSSAIGLVDSAGSHLGRLSPTVNGHRYAPAYQLHADIRCSDVDRVMSSISSDSALRSFDPLAA